MERLRVSIPDLTCASCVPHIEKVIRQQEGVIWAIVNFAAGEVTIIYDPADFSASKMVWAVRRLGYQLVSHDQPAVTSRKKVKKSEPLFSMQRWLRALSH